MKKFSSLTKIIVLLLVLTVAAPVSLPVGNHAAAEAATVKLSQKTLSLEVGQSQTLKLSSIKKGITWSTSDKSVATVSKNGKVTAIAAGNAKITAKVNKKKYTCKVTVKVSPEIANAPFAAVKETYGSFTAVIPKDWTSEIVKQIGNTLFAYIYPSGGNTNKDFPDIVLKVIETGNPQPDYSLTKETLTEQLTDTTLKSQFATGGYDVEISNLKSTDLDTKLGTALVTSFTATSETLTANLTIYDLLIDNYFIEITTSDLGSQVTPNRNTVAEYILNTLQ